MTCVPTTEVFTTEGKAEVAPAETEVRTSLFITPDKTCSVFKYLSVHAAKRQKLNRPQVKPRGFHPPRRPHVICFFFFVLFFHDGTFVQA